MNVCVFWIYMQTMQINFTICRKRHCCFLELKRAIVVKVSVYVGWDLTHPHTTMCWARLILSSICVHYFMHAINRSKNRSLFFISIHSVSFFLSFYGLSYFQECRFFVVSAADVGFLLPGNMCLLIFALFRNKTFYLGKIHLSFKPPRDAIVLQVNAVINISNKVCVKWIG